MEIHREIRETTSETLTISLPNALRRRRVEILVVPLDDAATREQEPGWPKGFLERLAGSVPDFPDPEAEGS